jgi:hypothetical protein
MSALPPRTLLDGNSAFLSGGDRAAAATNLQCAYSYPQFGKIGLMFAIVNIEPLCELL